MINKEHIYAIVGASNNTEKYGYKVYKDLKAAGYKIVAINPNEEKKILGDPVYSSLTEYKKHIDMAICIVPPKITEKIIQEANTLGIKQIWMQPGAESNKAIRYCKENNMDCISNACIMLERPKEKIAILALSKAFKKSERNNKIQATNTQNFHKIGLDPIYYPSCFQSEYLGCPSIASRIQELHQAIQDPNISTIISAKGGRNSNQILSYIDFELIKTQPKPIIGYSDITTILNAIYSQTNIKTYHGPMLTGGSRESLKSALSNKTTHIDTGDSRTIQHGTAQGILVGGNLTSFLHLAGTKYFPDLKDKIVFLEDTLNTPANARDRALHQLGLQKGAEKISGILLAKTGEGHNITKQIRKKLFSQIPAFQNIPILANLNFGHVPNAETLIIGSNFNFNAK